MTAPTAPPSVAIPGLIPFLRYGENLPGADGQHPYPLDRINRPLKWILLASGADPDQPFGGFATRSSVPIAANLFPGVDPTGVSDSWAGLQAVFNTLQPFDECALRGIYKLSQPLTVASDLVTFSGRARFIAQAGANFESLLTATGRTGLVFRHLEFDANGPNRASGQTVRFMGAWLIGCSDCLFLDCTARNVRGFGGVSAVGLASSAGTRCRLVWCHLFDCGVAGFDADGIYTSGVQTLIEACDATNGTDTAFVIESSDLSGILGGTVDGFASVAAITNATVDHKHGNFIRGLTGRNWSAATGGIQLGIPGNTTGNLYDTEVEAQLYADTGAGRGVGPAIAVRVNGAGNVLGCKIRTTIRGATTQGVLVEDGDNVSVEADVTGTGDACVQFQGGAHHRVTNSYLVGGTFGVVTQGTAQASVTATESRGQSDHGVFAFDTSTITLRSDAVVGLIGKDAGATIVGGPQPANPDTSGANLAAVETEVNQLKATLRTVGILTP